MKPENDETGSSCCGHQCRKGVFLILLTNTICLYMLWALVQRVGVLQDFAPSIMPDVRTSSAIENIVTTTVKIQPTTNLKTIHVNPHDFDYLHNENNMCEKRSGQDVYLMITVCVAPANFKHRNVIRNTWGSIVKHNDEVRLIFLIGNPRDETTQNKINNESKTFNDIVQEDFVDSYRNLSLKSVAILKWTMSYCNHAEYLLKVDDDMFINVPYLLGVLKHRHLTNSVIGDLFRGSRPIRDKSSKWYTSLDMFKEHQYPDYLSGTAYIVSGDIVSKLYDASLSIPLFWLEDVYITGLCRRKIGAKAVADYGFTYTHRSPTGCDYQHIISGHKNTLEEITKIWQELQAPNLTCNHN